MAEDFWESVLYVASWAGVELEIVSTNDVSGRELARYRYARRSGAELDDMGGVPRATRCQIAFRGEAGAQAFMDFQQAVDKAKAFDFVHPVFGTYSARVSDVSSDAVAELRDVIMVSCTFEEDTLAPALLDIGQGAPVAAGVEEVSAAAAQLDEAMADMEEAEGEALTSDVGPAALAVVTAWDEDSLTTIRDVQTQLESVVEAITVETTAMEVASNLNRFPVMAALVGLASAVRRVAAAFIARSPRVIELTVPAPVPLLAFAAQIYGADQAQDRYDEMLELNDVPNPARIEAGTVLKAQAVA